MEFKKLVCPGCAALNRVPSGRMSDRPVCGRCQQPLLPSRPIELSDRNFAAYVARTEVPVLVDFWAAWCGPCKAMAPAFAQASEALSPQLVLAKVDTEAAPQTAASFRIASIPTMILFQGGREVARQSGAMSASHIAQWARSSLPA